METNFDDRDLRIRWQPHLTKEFLKLRDAGCTRYDFLGGRRSGKTYFILQYLLGRMGKGYVVNVATMTDTQGRLGAYQDAKDILAGSPNFAPDCVILSSPKEIRHKSGGRMFFNSYATGERAKGIACDYLYINEANNFTEEQYRDLKMSVRRFTFADRNPNTECWTERNGFSVIRSTWKDNACNLTPAQIEEFELLKQRAEAPNATSADIAFYRMYYLGEYAEIIGDIFTPANIIRETCDTGRLYNVSIIADPSNLTGADFFASVCVATDGARVYILDAFSINTTNVRAEVTDWSQWCERWKAILDKWREWVLQYGVEFTFCESNGVGAEFIRYARSQDWEIKPYASTGNKHKRIKDNYENIISRVVWNDTESVSNYLTQVYEYTGKDESGKHDDNIDCASSAFDIYYKQTNLMR